MIELRYKAVHGKRLGVVYKIQFDTGHFYIGSTNSPYKRFSQHQSCLKHKYGSLWNAVKDIGATKGKITILKTDETPPPHKKNTPIWEYEKKMLRWHRNNPLFINAFVPVKKKV